MEGQYDKNLEWNISPAKPRENQEVRRDKRGRFLPGSSGNPEGGDGRPPGSISITREIRKKLLEIPKGSRKTYLKILVSKIIKKAVIDGDYQMIKQIWSYLDGIPKFEAEKFKEENVQQSAEVDPEVKLKIKKIVELTNELERMEEEENKLKSDVATSQNL
jgi:hypothetical protein